MAGLAPADMALEMEKPTPSPLGTSHPDSMTAVSCVQVPAVKVSFAMMAGIIPHQIRGSMRHFNSRVLHACAYDRCIACSPCVVEAYKSRGMDFLYQVFDSPTYLQEMTGLTKLFEDVEDLVIDDWTDDDM